MTYICFQSWIKHFVNFYYKTSVLVYDFKLSFIRIMKEIITTLLGALWYVLFSLTCSFSTRMSAGYILTHTSCIVSKALVRASLCTWSFHSRHCYTTPVTPSRPIWDRYETDDRPIQITPPSSTPDGRELIGFASVYNRFVYISHNYNASLCATYRVLSVLSAVSLFR